MRALPRRRPGIVVGHGDMPEFLFEPDDVDAILAYMASLEK